ncbi:hypothetical protein I4U23_000877 [Adineta vaga]|nr:hypothetical protein I4U23_000877 [Adineta vaga]
MSFQANYPIPPVASNGAGFRIFVRSAYSAKYNFAVANYNYVSSTHKLNMRGGHLLLFRSIVVIVWIITMIFAILSLIKSIFIIFTIIFSLFYIVLSIYNSYVFFRNRNLLNATRLLPIKIFTLNGFDFEWIKVPLNSATVTDRMKDIDSSSLDRLRQEFVGNDQKEIICMTYTKQYADTYSTYPKELLLHFVAFLFTIIFGSIMAAL